MNRYRPWLVPVLSGLLLCILAIVLYAFFTSSDYDYVFLLSSVAELIASIATAVISLIVVNKFRDHPHPGLLGCLPPRVRVGFRINYHCALLGGVLTLGLMLCVAVVVAFNLFTSDNKEYLGAMFGVASIVLVVISNIPIFLGFLFNEISEKSPLGLLSCLPPRVVDEELSDMLEHLDRLKCSGASRGRIAREQLFLRLTCCANGVRYLITERFARRRN